MRSRIGRLEAATFLGLWCFLMIAGRSSFFRDPGTFWHTVVGHQILTDGMLPQTDTFSCTARGDPWIAGHWLGECAMAVAYRVGGLDTLLLATSVLLAGLYAWIVHRFLIQGIRPALAILITMLTMAASGYHFHARTHLATIILLGWTYGRLVDFESGRIRVRQLFWLVPVFVLWTNLHAGVIGGIATLALTVGGWWVLTLADRGRGRWLRWNGFSGQRDETFVAPIGDSPGEAKRECVFGPRQIIFTGVLLLACSLACLCHPYGIRILDTWFGLIASPILPELMDEHRPLLDSSTSWAVLALGATYVATLAGTAARHWRVSWFVPLVWLVLTFGRVRHGPLFAVTAAIAIAEMLPTAGWARQLADRGSVLFTLRRVDPDDSRLNWGAVTLPVAVIVMALICQTAGLRIPILGSGWARLDPTYWPVDLLSDLQAYEEQSLEQGSAVIGFEPPIQNGVATRPRPSIWHSPARTSKSESPMIPVFNEMLFGGFLIYYTPGLSVFIDDRCELYGESRLRQYQQGLAHDASKLDEWQKKFGFEIALTVNGSTFDKYCTASPTWEVVRRSEAATLYRHVRPAAEKMDGAPKD